MGLIVACDVLLHIIYCLLSAKKRQRCQELITMFRLKMRQYIALDYLSFCYWCLTRKAIANHCSSTENCLDCVNWVEADLNASLQSVSHCGYALTDRRKERLCWGYIYIVLLQGSKCMCQRKCRTIEYKKIGLALLGTFSWEWNLNTSETSTLLFYLVSSWKCKSRWNANRNFWSFLCVMKALDHTATRRRSVIYHLLPSTSINQTSSWTCILAFEHTRNHTHVNTKTSISQVCAPPRTSDCVLWCRRHFLFNIPLSCARKTESSRDITMLERVKTSGLTWEQKKGNRIITEW